MSYARWGALVLVASGLGIFFLIYLTVHPLRISLYLFLSCLFLFGLILILVLGFKGRDLAIAAGLSLLVFIGGYYVSAKVFFSRDDPRQVPEITRVAGDPGGGHTAIVYFTHGEPETYDPIGWINQFREFDEQGIPFVPFMARPFFVFQLRNKYLEVGSSHHRQMHIEMLHSLEEAYRQEGDETTQFYISFLDDDPRPDAAVIQALNDGASHIIVSEVFLTISNHTAEGEELIEALNIEEEYGVTLDFTGPLWDSETLRGMFVSRANAHIGSGDKSKVGVLLVGHGQPDEWDVEWATETEQEILFREEVLALFEADGYLVENMALAWMEFKEPHPDVKVEEFWENGVEQVVFFSAAISADSIHSQWDIPNLISEADVPEDMIITNLGAWNNDALVIQAIKEKIDEFMR